MSEVKLKKAKPKRKHQGHVVLLKDRCKGCGICVEFCPTHVLVMGHHLNPKGYHPPEIAKPEDCSGCDLCGLFCPDLAIHGYRTAAGERNDNQKGCTNES